MKAALVLAALLASVPTHADDTRRSASPQAATAKAPAKARVPTQKLMPPPWERTPGGQRALRPAPIASGSPR